MVNVVVKSTDVNPVTQTALVEIKTANQPMICADGTTWKHKQPVPRMIKKLTAKSEKGWYACPTNELIRWITATKTKQTIQLRDKACCAVFPKTLICYHYPPDDEK